MSSREYFEAVSDVLITEGIDPSFTDQEEDALLERWSRGEPVDDAAMYIIGIRVGRK